MKYRKFGKLDWEVSALGFGAMRLPLLDNTPTNIDKPQAIEMIRYAIDHGVNYVDTAYQYHGGESEKVVGLALKDGYREKTKLTTKLLSRVIESSSDFDRLFDEQLKRLQVDKVDFYLLHGLNIWVWQKVKNLGVLKWAESQMAKGRIGHFGFSFHDDYESFQKIVDDYDNWTIAQVLYNYMDYDFQAGRKGVEYAAKKGISVVVMEPLRGGHLAEKPPASVAKIWKAAPVKRSPVEWGLMWVWNQPEITLVLSGMSTMAQVVENVGIADRSGPNILSKEDLAVIAKARKAFNELNVIPCTGCRYCMPCPSGVDIPTIFKLYNQAVMAKDPHWARLRYSGVVGLRLNQRADRCIECGQCVGTCPQKIPVTDWLKKARELLDPKK